MCQGINHCLTPQGNVGFHFSDSVLPIPHWLSQKETQAGSFHSSSLFFIYAFVKTPRRSKTEVCYVPVQNEERREEEVIKTCTMPNPQSKTRTLFLLIVFNACSFPVFMRNVCSERQDTFLRYVLSVA